MRVQLRRSETLATRGGIEQPNIVRVGAKDSGSRTDWTFIAWFVIILGLGAAAMAFGDTVVRKALQ